MSSLAEDPSIAIIGFAFEFPQGATDCDSFWEMIHEGRLATTDFPADRLNGAAFYHRDEGRQGSIPVHGGSFINGNLAAFDAPFFSVTPGEAACMDPQHRRMLEATYHALEDAGVPLAKCSGSDTSVYTGCFTNDYLSILQQDYELEQRHAAVGIAPSMLANRVSWFFNFKGTSMNIDSACSSSLLALHLACQDLRSGSASMALAGGANLVYHPNFMKIMSGFGLLSPDSCCRSFDERANGYARGEGIVMVVLKRLTDALRDGDTVRAVIRATGTNQDGRTPGITQPSLEAQVELIRRTFQQSRLDMGPTRFVEAHGTGTAIGDLVEANAISEAFRDSRTDDEPLYIGAIKANIGHLEGASGLAAVIKTILVLENGIIPSLAGREVPNKRIDSRALRIHFLDKSVPWPAMGVRRACVSSFGFGGTNAIVVLDDACHYMQLNGLEGYHRTRQTPPANLLPFHRRAYATIHISAPFSSAIRSAPEPDSISSPSKPILLVLSAADKRGTEKLSAAYTDYIHDRQQDIPALAYALAMRRTLLPWRSFLVVNQRNGSLSVAATDPVRARDNAKLAFIFTGQGAQYMGMGSALFCFPVFQDSIKKSDQCLHEFGCSWSLRSFLAAQSIGDACNDTRIDSPTYSQPLTTCLQIALVDLLESLGVVPSVVIGHSSGEIAAAYAVGALSRSSAIRVAYYRGLLSSRLASERDDLSMMAVGLSRKNVASYLSRLAEAIDDPLEISVGCVNSPQSVSLTGKVAQLEILQAWFESDSVFARRLRTPMAYHSPIMDGITAEYQVSLQNLEHGEQNRIRVPIISSVIGDFVPTGTMGSAEYWTNNLTGTVEFEAALTNLVSRRNISVWSQLGQDSIPQIDLHVTDLLEIGPHNALEGAVRETVRAVLTKADTRPDYVPLLRRGQDANICLLVALGHLHGAGYPVDISKVNDTTIRGGRHRSPAIPPDIPLYPFNHTRTYWKEGRLSRNFRFRTTARHDLLGSRSLDWNAQVAQWRNILRAKELLWLQDHQVDGQIVVPATAMVVMAVEAIRQLLEPAVNITSVDLRDVKFLHAIRFRRKADEPETQLIVASDSNPTPAVWLQFRLFVIDGEEYVECCRGVIRGNSASCEGDTETLTMATGENAQSWASRVSSRCKRPKAPYGAWNRSAVRYGPRFQNLEQLRVGAAGEASASASASVNTESWKSGSAGDDWATQYPVHPCTMDGLAQLIAPALNETYGTLPTILPTGARSIWIDCSDAQQLYQGNVQGVAECSAPGNRGATATIAAVTEYERPVLVIEDLEVRYFDATSTKEPDAHAVSLCTELLWRPSITLMRHEQIREIMIRGRPKEDEGVVQHFEAMNLAIRCFIQEALVHLDESPSLVVPAHLERYITWMRHQQQITEEEAALRKAVHSLLSCETERDYLTTTVENSGPEGLLFMLVGRHLISILSGSVDPLELIFRDGLADRYYEQVLANPHHAHPGAVYLQQLCFANPAMKIIELGAGTGGLTLRSLQALGSDGMMKCSRYDYTDISPVFFASAQERFKDFADVLHFLPCDISEDPGSQGFELGSYDIVIASHVLHATRRLDEALLNTRKLLKQGGKLLLLETTRPETLHLSFGFGVLKGWWDCLDYESRSEHSPCLTSAQWHRRLTANGFSGVEVEVPGQENEQFRYSSIMVSTAVAADSGEMNGRSDVVLVIKPHIPYQREIAGILAQDMVWPILGLADFATSTVSPSTIVIFLISLHDTTLDGISTEEYGMLKAALTSTKNTLWVGQSEARNNMPQQHLAEGLGRALASEDWTRKFVTLLLDHTETPQNIVGYIMRLVEQIEQCTTDALEINYTAADGVLCIPRVFDDSTMNKQLRQALDPRRQTDVTLSAETKVSLSLGLPGMQQTARYIEDDHDASPVAKDEILVQVAAFGLTSNDYLASSGQIDGIDLGSECAGTVIEAGSETTYTSGDRVCLIGKRLARTHVCSNARYAAPIPDSMSFTEAASLPMSLWTAYHALYDIARVRAEDTVLVLDATSCVGQMLAQLAMDLGASVIVTARTLTKRDSISESLHDSGIYCFVNNDASLTREVQRITTRQGVDIVIGALADHDIRDISRCLGPCSRVVDLSIPGSQASRSRTWTFEGNVSYARVSMMELLARRPLTAQQTFYEAMRLHLSRHFKPPQPLRVFAASDIDAALDRCWADDLIEKRVVELVHGASLLVDLSSQPEYSFATDATYIISGGLGGIGRCIARWMVSRGARHLVLLSRSGISTSARTDFVNELLAQGITIATPKVDVGSLSQLRGVLSTLRRTMPPVRGCVQASMALRDNLFENMTHEDWTVSLNSKVAGSWNLHQLLPENLDFFILLSSLNGIFGNWSQANYAAGNSFQDALARYRVAQGQKAVSIDLGVMVSDGVVAENATLRESMRRIGLISELTQEHLLALLDHYCNPNLPCLSQDDAQVLVGIENPSVLVSKGIDLHHSIRRPMFSHLFRRTPTTTSSQAALADSTSTSVLDRPALLKAASRPEDASALVLQWTSSKVSQVLGIPVSDVSPEKPIHTYGIDSLVAVDLKNWFEREIGTHVTVLDLMGHIPLQEICAVAAQNSRYRP